MSQVSTDHATFIVERTLPHPPARVYAAFAESDAKARWFLAPSDWTTAAYAFDFQVGGREHLESVPPEGPAITFDATYLDIVPGRRIIYSYDMQIGAERISVSLAAIELEPTMGGTRLTVTEHGVYLDGLDDVAQRRQGTEELIDAMVRSLDGSDGSAGSGS